MGFGIFRKINKLIAGGEVGVSNEKTRHQWVIKKLSQIKEGNSILDAGAGEQRYRKYCKHLKYQSQDFGEYKGGGDGVALQTGMWDTTNIDYICDIVNIPVDNFSFDVVLCTEVLEHLKNPVLAIKEFSRIIKTGGILILTAPFTSLTHFSPYHYATGFNKYWYQEHLGRYNFVIEEIVPNGNYFEFVAQEIQHLRQFCTEYSNIKAKPITQLCISVVLRLLRQCSAADRGSYELLNFGYHVVAIKK